MIARWKTGEKKGKNSVEVGAVIRCKLAVEYARNYLIMCDTSRRLAELGGT